MSESYKRDEKGVEVVSKLAAVVRGYSKNGKKLGRPRKRKAWNTIVLTDEQREWLREYYPDMYNADIAKHMGFGLGTLHKFARAMGLKKSAAFMKRNWQRGVALAHKKGVSTGFEVQRLAAKRQWQKLKEKGLSRGFAPGMPNRVRFGKRWEEMKAKMYATRQATIARDHRRVALGLAPLTRLVVAVKKTREEVCLRCNMKRWHGYIVMKSDSVIYYDENTDRSAAQEAHAKRLGIPVISIHSKLTDQAI